MAGWDARLRYVDISLSPVQVAANTSASQTFDIPGVRSDDMVIGVNKPTHQAGLGIVGARVVAEGQVAIVFGNFTAAGITPTASETYSFGLLTKQP